MKASKLKTSLANSLSKISFKVGKSSPEILIVTAVIGSIAGVVTACVATTKVPEVIEEHKETIEKIHNAQNDEDIALSEEAAKKAITKVYARTILKFSRLYAVPIIIEAASITCMISSHKMMRNRCASWGAAYATLDTAFKNYRKNVIERFGEDIDRELRYNLEKKEIEETVVDEKGKEKKVVKEEYVLKTLPGYSEYAKIFDETNPFWQSDNEINKASIKNVQNTFNELLRARGYVFLNEVYIALGFQPTKAGQIVGWLRNGKDNCIDFGIYTVHKMESKKFINGYEKAVILDFNVDGPIIDDFQSRINCDYSYLLTN